MLRIKQEHLRTITRRIWVSFFTLVILIAVIIQLGRQAFPMITEYRDEITAYIEEKIGMQVEVGDLKTEWSGLRPSIGMRNVKVISEAGVAIFTIEQASAQLSLIDSLLKWRFSLRQLKFDGFATSLVQDKEGNWSVLGAPALDTELDGEKPNPPNIIDDPYDIFLFGRRINITNARFLVQFDTGKVVDIQIPEISLENDKNFHRLLAKLDVEEGKEAFHLIVEGEGDPRDQNFAANGYLELRNFSTTKVLQALGGKIAGKTININEADESTLDVNLWFRGAPESGMTFRGSIDAHGVPIELTEAAYNLPKSIRANVSGKMHKEKGWEIGLQETQILWQDLASPKLDIQLSGGMGKRVVVKTEELDLGTWTELLLHVGLNNETIVEAIKEVNPQGQLKDINVRLMDKENGYFIAQARIENGSSGAIMGAPAFDGVSGHLEFSMFEGKIDVNAQNGFSVFLPKVYNDPLHFDEASGQVSWEVNFDKRIVYITSGLLSVTNAEETGKGYLYLSLPFDKDQGEAKMTLSVGVENTLAANHKRYVPKTIPKHLYQWLESSIKEGEVKNVRFIYHGSVEKDPQPKPAVQFYAEVYNGNLSFDPKWPELQNVSGILKIENDKLDVRIDNATLLGNLVHDAQINVVKGAGGRLLSIKGGLHSDVESAVTLLKSSPINQYMGSTFDNWQMAGGVSAQVELLIPLSTDDTGVSHKIDVEFRNANLEIPDIDLDIQSISGDLHYQTHKGIFTKNLYGEVWGEGFSATISSPKNSTGGFDTLIGFKGAVDIQDLQKWTKRPELQYAKGKSSINGLLSILHAKQKDAGIKLDIDSNLVGTEINLPAPFTKTKQQDVPFSSRIRFFKNMEEYEFLYGNALRVILLSDEYYDITAQIDLGNFQPRHPEAILVADGKFNIRGKINEFDLDRWNSVLDQYVTFNTELLGEVKESKFTPAKVDVEIEKFLIGSFEIDNIAIQGERLPSHRWDLNIDSELMSGLVRVSEVDAPVEMLLSRLKIAADEDELTPEPRGDKSEKPKQSVLADLDLSRAVALKFSADQFYLGEEDYGSWKFDVEPLENGILINNIQANVKGMRLGESGLGAKFVWMKDQGAQSSQFVGTITANNLADVFEAWGQEKLLESQSARIDIDAQWNAAPDQVTLKTVKGLVILDVMNGSFNRGAGSDENAFLRLLALFNFDTILRRLRLDFADLAAQGFSFDKIYGSLNFENGNIYLIEPLIVESSSSVVQVAGTLDVIDEKLDTEMVVTLPFASNLAVATAVVAGLPTAVGIYLMSKLFKSQVDQASSINMQVTGKWEDPKIKIAKIFDIDAASRKGRETEKKTKNRVTPEFHRDPILENELEQRMPPVEE